MILAKEFYFIRHGQTDHNISKDQYKGDHISTIPLNETGRKQALAIQPVIATLPFHAVYSSPMKRAKETAELITQQTYVEIEDLSECTLEVWQEMYQRGMYTPLPVEGKMRFFAEKVLRGINQVLSQPGTPLIIAHGGIHWALCSLINIETHPWGIENCDVVHFFPQSTNKWAARKMTS